MVVDFDQRFGMTDRIEPGETGKIWEGLKHLRESGLLRPTLYEQRTALQESGERGTRD